MMRIVLRAYIIGSGQHSTVLYCTALYCTALYCTVLHSTVQVSSPGRPLPVKFDFNAAVAVAGDPSIACPVPLRVSPDSPAFHHESSGTESRGKDRK